MANKKILGIDEAGRGPVIGDLVISGFLIEAGHAEELKELGIKDSKLISPKNREKLFDTVKDKALSHKTYSIPPEKVDEYLNNPDKNLNWLEADYTIKIINELKPDLAYVDCPSINVEKYKAYLQDKLNNKNIELIVEHKADVNYPEVGAASILAKVTRDRSLKIIEEEIGKSIGSGYPSDPKTRAFLEDNWDKYDKIFRKTWESYKSMKRKKAQSSLLSFK